ncbi:MHS family MFS transporter [Nocardia sp. CA2R105]|uniref:MFS transporter n=1 Tax=Nocardia coffeae TaxID=2873381 RepID=UPI001CA67DC0|nr:MFS transporter [Nocardia coffeae]MBY8861148.1 MHS family MFS transporter [Nocardia coffeae]
MSDSSTTSSWETQRRSLLPASVIGTVLEWYDMFVYAQAASLIFATIFFPKFSSTAGTLAALATFGAGYVARPIGAVVFGHIGDKLGRKKALSFTLLLMGSATTLIGVLPSYATAGLLAPILLAVLRLLQGLGSGAEFAGSFVMIAEFAPRKRRGFWTSLPGMGVYIGIVLATIVGLTVFHLPKAQLYSWGWRLPFLISFVLIIIGLIMRLRMAESPVFEDLGQRQESRRIPIVAILRRSPRTLLLSILLTAPIAFNAYVASTYSLTYGVKHGASQFGVLIGSLLGAIVAMMLVPVAGRLSDHFGRRPVYITMTALSALTAVPYFLILDLGGNLPYWVAQALIIAPFTQALTGGQAAFLAELFEPRYRYTGVALSREFSTAILTSTAPIVALGLVSALGGKPWLLAGAMVVVSLAGLLGAAFLPETRGIDMHTTEHQVGPSSAEPTDPRDLATAGTAESGDRK